MNLVSVTLNEVLAARDERAARQKKMQAEFHTALISLTVVTPGEVKRTDNAKFVADIADEFIKNSFGEKLLTKVVTDKLTGYEIIYSIDLDPIAIKKITATYENSHPLGRLMDIDVIAANGVSVSRNEIGMENRLCLLCDKPSAYCVKARTHTNEQLQEKIKKMIAEFRQSQ
ncbi:MAG TPA: citrate lyase holo-[acyl-carrier protein] synthase [Clostridia bacterium]|nr:citrate lyase holo-[acyl-carrier protein] synthase [Clostridia bacterium]